MFWELHGVLLQVKKKETLDFEMPVFSQMFSLLWEFNFPIIWELYALMPWAKYARDL